MFKNLIEFLFIRPEGYGISREKLISYVPMLWGLLRILGVEWATDADAIASATWLESLFSAADVAWNALSPFVVGMFMFMQRHLRRSR